MIITNKTQIESMGLKITKTSPVDWDWLVEVLEEDTPCAYGLTPEEINKIKDLLGFVFKKNTPPPFSESYIILDDGKLMVVETDYVDNPQQKEDLHIWQFMAGRDEKED